MLITDLETQTRNQYNAVGDSFFGSTEIIHYFYEACTQLGREAYLIEKVDTSVPTVISQLSYDIPQYVIAIKRLEYNGQKLKLIDFREDDMLTSLNHNLTATGTPVYFAIFNRKVYLRPIPDAVQTLTFYSYNEPAALTASSTLEIPTQFHTSLIPYALSCMYAKDKDISASAFYKTIWEKEKSEAKKWARKMRRGDAFAVVKSEDHLAETILGFV